MLKWGLETVPSYRPGQVGFLPGKETVKAHVSNGHRVQADRLPAIKKSLSIKTSN